MAGFSSYRQLFIFKGGPASEKLVQQQLDLLAADSAGVKDRVLKVTIAETSDALHQKYNVAPGEFMVVLVGKDGYEKYRAAKPLSTAQLSAIIDAMPMRRQEIKKH